MYIVSVYSSFGLLDIWIGACSPHTNILFFIDFGVIFQCLRHLLTEIHIQ